MSRFQRSLLLLALLGPATGSGMAQNTAIGVLVDGKPVNFGGVPPTQADGRLLVPLRGVFEALGAKVDYNPATATVHAQRGDTRLQLTIGSNQAYVNGQARTLEVPAQAIFGRTLVPLRFVAEALGAQVSFNSATSTVAVTSPPGPPPAYAVPGANQTLNGTLVKVENTNPPGVTVSVEGALRTLPLLPNALILRQLSVAPTATATPVKQTPRQINRAALTSGDPVRIVLNEAGRVTQLISTATVIVARVQFAAGDQIVLEDERDTTLTIGPNLRYVDPQGKSATSVTLTPGQSVGLYISRLSRTIYQVSAYAPDFSSSGTGTPDPIGSGGAGAGTTLPPSGTPKIQSVQHNAGVPLKAGAQIQVTVRGTAGLRGSFDVGPKIVGQTLTEDPARLGVYNGAYTVKAGEDVLNGRVTARLLEPRGLEDVLQSEEPITVDTVAPRLIGTFPANLAQINVAQPNIAIFADDLGGSGLGSVTVDLISGPADADVKRIPATLAPPTAVNAVPPTPLSGQVGVRAVITDKAGNALPVSFGFFVITGGNLISSFTHGAARAMLAGEEVSLSLAALPGGRASFDVLNGRGETVVRNQPMIETNQLGRYRATYKVPANPPQQLRFVGKFTATDNTSTQLEAITRVMIQAAPIKFSISAPADASVVTTPVIVRGQAAPGAIVDVAVRAEGTQFFILEYKEELGTQQVRADANGNWQSKPVDLPARRNVADLRYIVTATPTDATNKQGEAVSIAIRTK